MEISLDPNVDGYHTIFNLYSDLSDLAASTLSVKNFGSNGFDLCIDNTDWVNFDFNSQFNMGSGVTFSNEVNVGKVLINLQGIDTNSHAVTTRSVSLVF